MVSRIPPERRIENIWNTLSPQHQLDIQRMSGVAKMNILVGREFSELKAGDRAKIKRWYAN